MLHFVANFATTDSMSHSSSSVAIDEMKRFLACSNSNLDDFLYLLIERGYDDVESLAEATDAEIDELTRIFRSLEAKAAIRKLVLNLREVGYAAYCVEGFASVSANEENSEYTPTTTELEAFILAFSFDGKLWMKKRCSLNPFTHVLLWYGLDENEFEGSAILSKAHISQLSIVSCKVITKFPLSVGGFSIYFEGHPSELPKWSEWTSLLTHCAFAPELGDNLKQERAFVEQLVAGLLCKKFKYGVEHKRLVWCTQQLDRVMWGEEKNTVKGFELVSDLLRVGVSATDGGFRIILKFTSRDLELETTSDQGQFWAKAFTFLLESKSKVLKKVVASQKQSVIDFQRKQAEYRDYLILGPTFKRYKNGKIKLRQIWVTRDLDYLYYGDDRNSIAGKIKLSDML